jgi:hypothetical protein
LSWLVGLFDILGLILTAIVVYQMRGQPAFVMPGPDEIAQRRPSLEATVRAAGFWYIIWGAIGVVYVATVMIRIQTAPSLIGALLFVAALSLIPLGIVWVGWKLCSLSARGLGPTFVISLFWFMAMVFIVPSAFDYVKTASARAMALCWFGWSASTALAQFATVMVIVNAPAVTSPAYRAQFGTSMTSVVRSPLFWLHAISMTLFLGYEVLLRYPDLAW